MEFYYVLYSVIKTHGLVVVLTMEKAQVQYILEELPVVRTMTIYLAVNFISNRHVNIVRM